MITVGLLGMTLLAAGHGHGHEPMVAGKTYERHLHVEGKHRSYSFHLPTNYRAEVLPPVVVGFHGFNTNGSVMEVVNQLSASSDRYGFIVVYPNASVVAGFVRRWNMQGDADKPNDVAFVAAVLDDLARNVAYDARRVYAVGKSTGGSMAYRVASEMPERIAAVASISGPLANPAFRPGPAVSILHFHGTNDNLVPIEGNWPGTPRAMRSIPVDETIRTWIALNGCHGTPAVRRIDADEHDRTSVEFRIYGPGRDGSEVVFCRIEGGGHTWPGGNPPIPLLFGRVTREIWANDVIWEFFSRHSR
jgi:polyhydroxybutyrate depolymerase